MNINDDLSPDKNNNEFEEALACIKQVEPTLEARIRYRQVIATELARIEERRVSVPRHWWRRSFSVPVPVALAVCTLLLVSFFVRGPSDNTPGMTAASLTATEESDVVNPIATSPTMNESDIQPRLVYSSETYLCGVGRLNYETIYQFQE